MFIISNSINAIISKRSFQGLAYGLITALVLSGVYFGFQPSSEVLASGGNVFSHTSTNNPSPTPAVPTTQLTWSSPIIITIGGTYTGNWYSTSASTPAVQINTTQPVTIVDSNIKGMFHLITSQYYGAQLTIKNTNGWGLNPNVINQAPGRFLAVEGAKILDIENNYMQNTGGIYATGFFRSDADGAAASYTVKYNKALNIDGRRSDGNNGWKQGPADFDIANFWILNTAINIGNVEVAWNAIENRVNESRVEDNINTYMSSGTNTKPIWIHDNLINGAFPLNPENNEVVGYSGGGIILDGHSMPMNQATNNVRSETTTFSAGFYLNENNSILNTTNYGVSHNNGHDATIRNNRTIETAKIPGTNTIKAHRTISATASPYHGAGIIDWSPDNDDTKTPPTAYNHYLQNNYVRWTAYNADGTTDNNNYTRYTPFFDGMSSATRATFESGNTYDSTTATDADITTEINAYTVKAANANVLIGTQPIAPTPTPTPTIQAIAYSGPLIITMGGTYTGNWESTNYTTPAIDIRTSEPVIIENSNIRAKGIGIQSITVGGSDVTLRQNHAYGINPGNTSQQQGLFFKSAWNKNLVIEHNYIEKMAGIYVYDFWGPTGNSTGGGSICGATAGTSANGSTLKIRYNDAVNLENRFSDGGSGYQNFNNNKASGFFQLNCAHGISGAEIVWNRIVNTPGQSRVDDTISVYGSAGISSSDPIRVSHNYLNGAYESPATMDFSGGGIMLGDKCDPQEDWITADYNTVIETQNYGIASAAGNNHIIEYNTVLNVGQLTNGTFYDEYHHDAGIYVRDFCNDPAHVGSTVIARNNKIGWGTPNSTDPVSRNDGSKGTEILQNNTYYNSTTDTFGAPTVLANGYEGGTGAIPRSLITQAINDWNTSVTAAGYYIGTLADQSTPNPSPTPSVIPTPTVTPTPNPPTVTPTPVPSTTSTPISTSAVTPTATPVPVVTPTPSPTPVSSVTPTPIRTVTPTPIRTVTPTPTLVVTPTPVPSVTPTPTRTPTPTPNVIVSPAPSITPILTSVVSPTPSPVISPTSISPTNSTKITNASIVLPNAAGTISTSVTGSCNTILGNSVSDEASNSTQDISYNYTYKMNTLKLGCDSVGGSAAVTSKWTVNKVDTAVYTLRKYASKIPGSTLTSDQVYYTLQDNIRGVVSGNTTIFTVSFSVTDGMLGDTSISDGIINDPYGLALSTTASNLAITGLDTRFVFLVSVLSLGIVTGITLSRKNSNRFVTDKLAKQWLRIE